MKRKRWRSFAIVIMIAMMTVLTGCFNETAVNLSEQEDPQSLHYEIQTDDCSVSDGSGATVVTCTYDRVVIQGDSDAAQKINDVIRRGFDQYQSDLEDEGLSGEYADDLSQYGDKLEYTVKADVVNNEAGKFSIKYKTTFYLGGVMTINYGGLTFDTSTGEVLGISELLGKSEGESLAYIKQQTRDYIKAHPGEDWWAPGDVVNTDDYLDECRLDNLDYYYEDGALNICYPTYALGPGSMGPVIVKCSALSDTSSENMDTGDNDSNGGEVKKDESEPPEKDSDDDRQTSSDAGSGIKSASVKDVVTFGSFEQDNNTSNGKEPIEWIVLKKENG